MLLLAKDEADLNYFVFAAATAGYLVNSSNKGINELIN